MRVNPKNSFTMFHQKRFKFVISCKHDKIRKGSFTLFIIFILFFHLYPHDVDLNYQKNMWTNFIEVDCMYWKFTVLEVKRKLLLYLL